VVAAQAARRLRVRLFIGEAALDALEVVLAFACLALGGVDTAVGRLVVQPRRGDLDAGVDLVVEAEVFVDIRRGDLAGRDVAGPVTQSPPAKTPSILSIWPLASATNAPRLMAIFVCSKPWVSTP